MIGQRLNAYTAIMVSLVAIGAILTTYAFMKE